MLEIRDEQCRHPKAVTFRQWTFGDTILVIVDSELIKHPPKNRCKRISRELVAAILELLSERCHNHARYLHYHLTSWGPNV
jgi:hypothetical protein